MSLASKFMCHSVLQLSDFDDNVININCRLSHPHDDINHACVFYLDNYNAKVLVEWNDTIKYLSFRVLKGE